MHFVPAPERAVRPDPAMIATGRPRPTQHRNPTATERSVAQPRSDQVGMTRKSSATARDASASPPEHEGRGVIPCAPVTQVKGRSRRGGIRTGRQPAQPAARGCRRKAVRVGKRASGTAARDLLAVIPAPPPKAVTGGSQGSCAERRQGSPAAGRRLEEAALNFPRYIHAAPPSAGPDVRPRAVPECRVPGTTAAGQGSPWTKWADRRPVNAGPADRVDPESGADVRGSSRTRRGS